MAPERGESTGNQLAPPPSSSLSPECLRKTITTEPALLAYFIGVNMHITLSQQMLFDKYCVRRYGAGANSSLECSNATLTDADDELQADTSRMRFYCTLVTVLPSVVVCAYLGAVGDRRSRKYPILLPPVGAAIAYALWALQCYFFDVDPSYALLSSFVQGASGYYPAALQTCYSYLTAVAAMESRTLRLAVAEGILLVALVAGGFSVGPLIAAIGLTGAYALLAVVSALGAIYCQLWLEDLSVAPSPSTRPIERLSTSPAEAGLTDVAKRSALGEDGRSSSCCSGDTGRVHIGELLCDSVRFALKKRPGHTNAHIRAALASLMLYYWGVDGAGDVLYLYLTKERGFSTTLYGFFTGAQYASRGLIGSTVLLVMRRCFGADDLAVAMSGTLSAAASFAVLAVAVSPWVTWLSIVANVLALLCSIGTRSYLSKCVAADEQGRLFALISVCQSVFTLVASLVFNNVYPASLGVYPGLCFAVASLLAIVAFVILGLLSNDVRARRHYVELEAVEEIKDG